MGNSEVYMELEAAIKLKGRGRIETSSDLESLLAETTSSIRGLYNESKSNYDYAKGNKSSWNKFYPDATAQLYPSLFGVVSASDLKSKLVYDRFNSSFPDWSTGKTYDTFPWTMIAYAAAVMGDKERVNAYITHIYGLNVKGEQKERCYDT